MILLFSLVQVILGILINLFMEKIVKVVFKKDGTFSRLPLRVLGIYLLINGATTILNVHLL